jgi:Integrase core domain
VQVRNAMEGRRAPAAAQTNRRGADSGEGEEGGRGREQQQVRGRRRVEVAGSTKGKVVRNNNGTAKRQLANDGRNLAKIYYDPSHPASFGGLQRLKKTSNVPLGRIKKWTEYQDPITLHAQLRASKKKKRQKIRVYVMNEQWDMDLIDMRKFRDENDGYCFILSIRDCFSKMGKAIPIKNKSAEEIIRALKVALKDEKPLKVRCDKGSEFTNKKVRDFLREKDIRMFTANNPDIKASIAENYNRELKSRLFRYFTHKNATRYVQVLPKIVDAINNAEHTTIKMKPTEVNKKNMDVVYKNIYKGVPPIVKNLKYKFKVGDHVRIKKEKLHFEKGYEQTMSKEVFVVSRIKPGEVAAYYVKDLKGEELDSLFYEWEMIKVSKIDYRKKYEIEKILDRKGDKVLVKWVGYPASFNEWIPKWKGLK